MTGTVENLLGERMARRLPVIGLEGRTNIGPGRVTAGAASLGPHATAVVHSLERWIATTSGTGGGTETKSVRGAKSVWVTTTVAAQGVALRRRRSANVSVIESESGKRRRNPCPPSCCRVSGKSFLSRRVHPPLDCAP
ncbi:unnamed protein product [Timema podura]|uniref:Uncharacterized protein n=1 Tax=Timema podura TaxID=61482 RepID=A0ABN7P4Q9_TIMPD|nr:unnamed protein product [Timema podura]